MTVFFLYFIYLLLIFGCAESLLLCRSSLVAASRGSPSLWWAGFSLQWLHLLLSTGSRRAGFSSRVHKPSCPTTTRGIFLDWGSNLRPPALAGGLPTTGPPGKSTSNCCPAQYSCFFFSYMSYSTPYAFPSSPSFKLDQNWWPSQGSRGLPSQVESSRKEKKRQKHRCWAGGR